MVSHIGDLKQDTANPRRHNPRNLKVITESLQKVGFARSIVIDEDNNILAGNGVIEGAAIAGIEKVVEIEADGETVIAVRRRGLTDEQKQALKYYDNRAGELAEWDPLQLAADLEAGLDLSAIFDTNELEGIIGQALNGKDGDTEPQIDKAAELAEKWGTATGQVWQLGRHRVACGDCTDRAVVEAVMVGERAEMMFTDPPYGVDYTGGHFHSGDVNIKRERPRLANDKSGSIYADFLPSVLPFIDGPCYVWFASTVGKPVYDAIVSNGCDIHAMIIWNKINATYAAIMAQYHQRHEPCLYFKPKRSTLRWVGPGNECTIWEIKRDSVNEFHPTQKPVELALRAIANHNADIVLDCFLGSGTTLIACENLSRQCRGIEIDPGYVAVTLQRFFDHTGIEPVLQS